MGLVRTLLAISVLITHSEPIFGIRLLSGDPAITCFYMISGFLMALILTERYTKIKAFYLNRALRIYPAYFFAVILGLLGSALIPNGPHNALSSYIRAVDFGSWPLLIWSTVSNFSLVGIDWTRYIALDSNDFSISFPNFLFGGGGGGHHLLFVPQAWTLAIEIQFYLIAPLLLRFKTRILVGLTVFFFFFRIWVYKTMRANSFPIDDGAIFILQIQYFLLGVLGYRLYTYFNNLKMSKIDRQSIEIFFALCGLGLILFGRFYLQSHDRAGYDLFYIAFGLTIPFIFSLFRNSSLSNKIGEYSYPIYVFHYAIKLSLLKYGDSQWYGESVLAITLLVSYLYLKLIDERIFKVREKVRRYGS